MSIQTLPEGQNALDFIPADKTEQANLARELTSYTEKMLPDEKRTLAAQLEQTAKEVRGLESNHADGRGQAIASIPPIAYHRWNLLLPGCWKDKAFVDEFLSDNRECLLPGYKPKAKTVYFDMAGGAPQSPGARLYWENKAKIESMDNPFAKLS